MEGIPAGDYFLTVVTHGYEMSSSTVLHHTGEGVVDLGQIALDPCGALEFEVVDNEGRPIPEFHVFLGGKILPAYARRSMGSHRHAFWQLPAGTVTIEVQAEGYRTASETLTLEAGKPAEHRFILDGE